MPTPKPLTESPSMKERILEAAANRMREFGYADVQGGDIMHEYVLRIFLTSILEDDENAAISDKAFRLARAELLAEIQAANAREGQ